MPFEPGVSGNPGGRRAEKPYRDMLRKVMFEEVGFDPQEPPRTKLEAVCRKHYAVALGGSESAMKEIADRLDGKAIQQIEADVQTNNVSEIRMVPVAPVPSE
jgi:hypothetical protein